MTSNQKDQLRCLRCVIGQNIRERRLKRKMTLVRLSRLANVNFHALDMFEMGKAEINLNQIFAIAKVLECDVAALVKL